ncbi:sugar MFS transporter [Candidatus Liberibacter africanus]|uniref:sugar MFS transporter n=1 Tax=Liberibacter africanus TaxID=34020 RepID=UPI001AE7F95C|nr:sugar MFS transporter [Candidatus Liberibacter africanus]QTP63661.1 sugar MFS transporter [Candidatus Liberibacter africanus]
MHDVTNRNIQYTKIYTFVLFFLFGGITSLNSILIPKLQNIFSLTYLQAMLVEAVFFSCYFFFSIPSGMFIQRYGYMKSICTGLVIISLGCMLFVITTYITTFSMFLSALYIVAIGVVMLQVALNPLVSLLGDPKTAASRLTFAQSFNSLGTVIFPYVGSILILNNFAGPETSKLANTIIANQNHAAKVISQIYLTLAIFLVPIIFLYWGKRDCFTDYTAKHIKFFKTLNMLAIPRFAMGTICIFLYVGAEVSIGSIMVNYLMRQDTLFLGGVSAGHHTAIYWGSAMIGRILGCWILYRFSTKKTLSAFAITACSLVMISSYTTGFISGWSLIAVGLCNSIMFPTIFSLANLNLKERVSEGSGIICTSISGGVIIPLVFGHLIDISSIRDAFFVPAICYMIIAIYAISCFYKKS